MNDAKGKPVTGQMDMFKVPVLVPELGDKVERTWRKAVSYYDAREPLTKATGFIDGYDYTANPYSGCTFSCAYCQSPRRVWRRLLEYECSLNRAVPQPVPHG